MGLILPIITSIACLDADKSSNRLALVLDVEQILHDMNPVDRDIKEDKLKTKGFRLKPGTVAIVADDSKVARSMIEQGLNVMQIPALMHVTGQEAWNKIQAMVKEAQQEGRPISDKISFVLTDLEMPEMDGFTLTRNIKRDDFLKKLPVIIHSSLSGSANEDHVRKVGADAYVAKFEVNELAGCDSLGFRLIAQPLCNFSAASALQAYWRHFSLCLFWRFRAQPDAKDNQ